MQKYEKELIFGNILEDIEDITLLKENEVSNLVHAKVADNQAVEMKEKAKKGKVSYYDAHQAEQRARAINIAADKENRKEKDKDPLSNEPLREDLMDNIKRREFNLKKQKQNLADQYEKRVDNIDNQLDNLRQTKRNLRATEENDSQEETVSESVTKNEIEKDENPEVISSSTLDGKETEGEKDGLNEGARIPLNPIDPEVKATIKQGRFAQMLFNGSSGDALKYFIYGEINNGNREEIKIAKKMKSDHEVTATINKIKWLLARAANDKFSDQDYFDLKVQKSKFRQLFYKYSKKQ